MSIEKTATDVARLLSPGGSTPVPRTLEKLLIYAESDLDPADALVVLGDLLGTAMRSKLTKANSAMLRAVERLVPDMDHGVDPQPTIQTLTNVVRDVRRQVGGNASLREILAKLLIQGSEGRALGKELESAEQFSYLYALMVISEQAAKAPRASSR